MEMSDEQETPTQASDASYSLPLSENEREVVRLALQELLSTTDREEDLIETIQALLTRLKTL
jgi:hypothetical protein